MVMNMDSSPALIFIKSDDNETTGGRCLGNCLFLQMGRAGLQHGNSYVAVNYKNQYNYTSLMAAHYGALLALS